MESPDALKLSDSEEKILHSRSICRIGCGFRVGGISAPLVLFVERLLKTQGRGYLRAPLYILRFGLHSGRFWVGRIELGQLNFFGEAELRHDPDTVVVDIEFVPGEAVPRAYRMGVVIVVPALAASQKSNPPAVARIIVGLEAALTPEMCRRIDQPGGVQSQRGAEEGSPQHHAECTDHAVAR